MAMPSAPHHRLQQFLGQRYLRRRQRAFGRDRASQGSNVGTYANSLSGASATSSTGQTYTVIYDTGAVTVTPRTVSYSVASTTGTYGAAVTGSVSWSNIYNNDNLGASVGLVSGTSSYSVASTPMRGRIRSGDGLEQRQSIR